MGGPLRGAKAVMARKGGERETERDLAGAARPSAFALHRFEPFQKTAHVDEQA